MSSFTEKKITKTVKAYRNADFLNSEAARNLRVLCELEETEARLKRYGVNATILFFGSARAKSSEDYVAAVEAARIAVGGAPTEQAREKAQAALTRLEAMHWMCEYYDKVVELSRRLSEWSLKSTSRLAQCHTWAGTSRYHYKMAKAAPVLRQLTDPAHETGGSSPSPSSTGIPSLTSTASVSVGDAASATFPATAITELGGLTSPPSMDGTEREEDDEHQVLFVCTGGGPGFMEAANKGAAQVPNARNLGMGISLPFEPGLNPYVTDELAFEYHYFFTRKYSLVFYMQALVVAPGGLGTIDELTEVLTLKQTGKLQKGVPIVLLGETFWRTAINWEFLASTGVISRADVDELYFTDDVEKAFEYIVSTLTTDENA